MITVRHGIIVGALAVLYLFLIQEGVSYSRMALMSMIPLYIFLTYIFREIWKKFLHKQMEEGGGVSFNCYYCRYGKGHHCQYEKK